MATDKKEDYMDYASYYNILVQDHSQIQAPSVLQKWNCKTEIYCVIVAMVESSNPISDYCIY